MPKAAPTPLARSQPVPLGDDEALTTQELYEEFLIALVDPDKRQHVRVEEERVADKLILTVFCHSADIGKVVGKEGKCLEECTKLLNRIEGRNRVVVELRLNRQGQSHP